MQVMIIREKTSMESIQLDIHTQKSDFDRDTAHGQPARWRARSTSIDDGPRNSQRAVTTLSVVLLTTT